MNTADCPTGTKARGGETTIRVTAPGVESVTLSIHAVIDDSSHPVRFSRREKASVNDPVPCKATLPLTSRESLRVPDATGVSDHSVVPSIATCR